MQGILKKKLIVLYKYRKADYGEKSENPKE